MTFPTSTSGISTTGRPSDFDPEDHNDLLDTKEWKNRCEVVLNCLSKIPKSTREVKLALPIDWPHAGQLGDLLDTLIAEGKARRIHGLVDKYFK